MPKDSTSSDTTVPHQVLPCPLVAPMTHFTLHWVILIMPQSTQTPLSPPLCLWAFKLYYSPSPTLGHLAHHPSWTQPPLQTLFHSHSTPPSAETQTPSFTYPLPKCSSTSTLLYLIYYLKAPGKLFASETLSNCFVQPSLLPSSTLLPLPTTCPQLASTSFHPPQKNKWLGEGKDPLQPLVAPLSQGDQPLWICPCLALIHPVCATSSACHS